MAATENGPFIGDLHIKKWWFPIDMLVYQMDPTT